MEDDYELSNNFSELNIPCNTSLASDSALSNYRKQNIIFHNNNRANNFKESIASDSVLSNYRKQNIIFHNNSRSNNVKEKQFYQSHSFNNDKYNSKFKNYPNSDSNDRAVKQDFKNYRNSYGNVREFNRQKNFKDLNESRNNYGNYRGNYNNRPQSGGFYSSRRNVDNTFNYGKDRYGEDRNHDKNSFSRKYGEHIIYRSDNSRGNHNSYKKYENNVKRNDKAEFEGMNQRESLIWQLNHNKYECMICVTNIRAEAPTWSCDNCYHIFHIICISKWATTCGNSVDKDGSMRCPACQKEYDIKEDNAAKHGKEWLLYRCFCGRQVDPVFKRGSVPPHCCEDVCGKPNKNNNENCPHLCSLMCHPGPCPPCEAIVTRSCHCQRTKITTKCSADKRTLICGDRCGKYLSCGLHQCENLCHEGECSPCTVEIEQKCCCDKKTMRLVICGSKEAKEELFCCGSRCERILTCGNHQCESMCHGGDCISCLWTPDRISKCWCGKKAIDELADCHRSSCLDPVPSCGLVCGRIINNCQHNCTRICHEKECGPCPLSRDVACRCGKTVQTGVVCASQEESVLCTKICNKKFLCGRHRCSERCCATELHLCLYPCGRPLTCKLHQCERECGHIGLCPSCPNVSFDELHCECGAATILPPIACGQPPPFCSKICTRDHACSHPVRHNCHSEEKCPPCTELMSKSCPGGHRILEYVPCFRAVATCGLVCGRPLSGCKHSCIRICHQGDCVVDNTKCTQPCPRPRSDCEHPCAAPCHENDCQDVMSNCMFQVILNCSCKMKSVPMPCYKLQNAISFIKFSNNSEMKRDNLDIIFSTSDNSVSLVCDNECKKNARNLKLADAFDISITASNLNTYYSDSLKNYAKKDIGFLIHVEKILLDLAKNVKNKTEVTISDTVRNLTEDKAEFINRYSACFKMNSKYIHDQKQKAYVIIEANRTNICTPKPLLSELLKNECPHLFPSKTEIEKNKIPSTASLTMSFADRTRLSKKE